MEGGQAFCVETGQQPEHMLLARAPQVHSHLIYLLSALGRVIAIKPQLRTRTGAQMALGAVAVAPW